MKKVMFAFALALIFTFGFIVYAQTDTLGEYNGIVYSVDSDGFITVEGFEGVGITLNIPRKIDGKTVKYIAEAAFYENVYITSAKLPETLTEIGESAFAHCPNLLSVTLPDSLEIIADSAFLGCRALTSVKFGTNLKRIEAAAFEGCTMLGKIKIPASLEYIGPDAFFGCERLTFNCGDNAYAKDYAEQNHINTGFFSPSSLNFIKIAAVTAVLAAAAIIIKKFYIKNKD